MHESRSYRIESRTRGIEGPLTAAAIVSMARAGLLVEGDRVERSPGVWVPVTASAELRQAIAARAPADRRYVTATSSSAALVSLRFAMSRLVADRFGHAELLAIVVQHPGAEVAEAAGAALLDASPERLAGVVRAVLWARRCQASAPGWQRRDEQLERLRPLIVDAVREDEWPSFAGAARAIAPNDSDGMPPIWAESARAVFEGSIATARLGSERLDDARSRIASHAEAVAWALERVRDFDGDALDLSQLPIADLESLPAALQDAMRAATVIDLSYTLLRTVPAWLLLGKSTVDLSATRLERLPDLPPVAEGGDSPLCGLDLDVSMTGVREFPRSWSCHELDSVNLSACPLHPRSFANLPACRSLTAQYSGLLDVEHMNAAPIQVDLSINWLREVPRGLRGFIGSIEQLDLDHNLISELPDWLSDAAHLESLSLRSNRIRAIRHRLSALPSLESVDLGENMIARICDEAFADRKLDSVLLDANRIERMPGILYPMERLDLSSNPLKQLPIPLDDIACLSGTQDDREDDGDAETDDLEVDEECEEGEEYEVAEESEGDDEREEYDEGEESSGEHEIEVESFGIHQAEFEDPDRGALSLDASETDIETFPVELMELKFREIRLRDCRRLRSIPANILWMRTLDGLDCLRCSSLAELHSVGIDPWCTWPDDRRHAVHEAYEQRFPNVEAQDVGFCGTGFREVPPMFSMEQVRCDIRVDLTDSRIERWDTRATTENLTDMRLGGTPMESCGSLSHFAWLKRLELPEGRLRTIPDGLDGCTDLAELALPGLPASAYPEALAAHPSVRSLSIHGRGLVEFPRILTRMRRLEHLHLVDTLVEEIPGWLAECPRLQTLKIDNSPIRRIDPAAFGARGLETLEVAVAHFIELPDFPEGCALEHLRIADCKSLRVPASIARCVKLRSLDLSRNRQVELPIEIADLRGLERIAIGTGAHWDRLKHWLRRHLPVTELVELGSD